MEERGTGLQSHSLFPGIDEIPILLTDLRRLSKIENAVFRVEYRFPAGWLVTRDHLRKADTKVDIGTVSNVLGCTPGDLGVAELVFFVNGACHA
ncbi:hypothetical protein D3C80_2062110 [compost metagenome]